MSFGAFGGSGMFLWYLKMSSVLLRITVPNVFTPRKSRFAGWFSNRLNLCFDFQDLVLLLKPRLRLEGSKHRRSLRLVSSNRTLLRLVEVVLASSSSSKQRRLVVVLHRDLVALHLPLALVPLNREDLARAVGQHHLGVGLPLGPSQLRPVSGSVRQALLQPVDSEVPQ
jgi:hypothetical protein